MDTTELAESPPPTPTPLPLDQSINRNPIVSFHRSQIQSPNSISTVHPSHALEHPIFVSTVPLPPLSRPPIPSPFSASSDDLPDPADIEDFTAVLFNRPRPPRPGLSRPDSRPVQSWQGPPATFMHQFRGDPVVSSTTTAVMPVNDVRPALKPYTRPNQTSAIETGGVAIGRKRQRDPIEEIFDLPTILREQRETILARMEVSEKGKKMRLETKYALKMELEREKLKLECAKFKLKLKFCERQDNRGRNFVELLSSDEDD